VSGQVPSAERAKSPQVEAPGLPPRMYHAMSNTFIERIADTVGAMGRYEDRLVKRYGEWLILNRKIMQ
jgi:hypothetical protein